MTTNRTPAWMRRRIDQLEDEFGRWYMEDIDDHPTPERLAEYQRGTYRAGKLLRLIRVYQQLIRDYQAPDLTPRQDKLAHYILRQNSLAIWNSIGSDYQALIDAGYAALERNGSWLVLSPTPKARNIAKYLWEL